jgi:predicted ATPase
VPKRQRTLRDAITWSFDLLAEDERTMLRLFAVFSGACRHDVEATAGLTSDLDDIDVIEFVGPLVDKSLRIAPGSDGAPRFSMLRAVWAYAAEQIDAVPDFASAVRLAHATHYSQVALRLQQRMTHTERSGVLLALTDELGNLRTGVGRVGRSRRRGLAQRSTSIGSPLHPTRPNAVVANVVSARG